jgi:hypothetical protein
VSFENFVFPAVDSFLEVLEGLLAVFTAMLFPVKNSIRKYRKF